MHCVINRTCAIALGSLVLRQHLPTENSSLIEAVQILGPSAWNAGASNEIAALGYYTQLVAVNYIIAKSLHGALTYIPWILSRVLHRLQRPHKHWQLVSLKHIHKNAPEDCWICKHKVLHWISICSTYLQDFASYMKTEQVLAQGNVPMHLLKKVRETAWKQHKNSSVISALAMAPPCHIYATNEASEKMTPWQSCHSFETVLP